jgi:hypothetical protein
MNNKEGEREKRSSTLVAKEKKHLRWMNFIKIDEWVPCITFASDGLSMAPADSLLRRELLSEEERRRFERERERERGDQEHL